MPLNMRHAYYAALPHPQTQPPANYTLHLYTREGETHLAVMPLMRARHTRDRRARMDFMLNVGSVNGR